MSRVAHQRSLVVVTAAIVLTVVACGKSMPPSGGPVDKSPPQVLGTSPSLFETGIAWDRPLRIAFNERMNRSSVEDGIVIRPHVVWRDRFWKADTLVLVPRDGWPPKTTLTLLLRSRISDRRGNLLAEPAIVVFTTADTMPRGQIAGRLERIGVSTGEVLMLAFDEPPVDTLSVDPLLAISVGEPDESGRFLLPGLRIGRDYEIGAFFDINEDRAFDAESDLYCRALEPVRPDSAGGPTDVSVKLVWADESGTISGVVVDSTCDAVTAMIDHRAADRDSMMAKRDSLIAYKSTLLARADSLFGEVVSPVDSLSAVEPDRLRGSADSLRAAVDSLAIPDSVAIAASVRIPMTARADSAYCERAIIARFWSPTDSSATFEDQPTGWSGAYRMTDVPPGAYLGVVWRDLNGDGLYTAAMEPGTGDTLRIWVPPGQSGGPDSLMLGRPESFTWSEE